MSREFTLRPRGPSHSFRHRFDLSVAASARRSQDQDQDQDLKLFVLSFTAFFICVYTLIF